MEVGVVELRMHVLEMNLNMTCLFGKGLFATDLDSVCLATVCLRTLTAVDAIALHNSNTTVTTCALTRLRLLGFTWLYSAALGFHSSHGGEHTSTINSSEVCD